ncbi:serine/threonine protein kinase, partial [Trifolium medium]|nr:serine/threonine protein kinase [Trifolium medium]
MQDLVAANESYDINDLEDEFKGHDIKVFNYTLIMEATMDFSPENKLGQGGYGPVYKIEIDPLKMTVEKLVGTCNLL